MLKFLCVVLSLSFFSLNAADKPNIIMIMADDLGYEVIGANGCTSYKTPELDKIAASGLRFENCFANPLCTLRGSYLVSMNNKKGIKYRGLQKTDQWQRFNLESLDCKSFRTVKDEGLCTYIMPFNGKYSDKVVKVDLKLNKIKILSQEIPNGYFLNSQTLSDDGRKALFSWLPVASKDNKKVLNKYMLLDFETEKFEYLPDHFQCESQSSFRIFENKIAVFSGYPENVKVYDPKSFKENFRVHLLRAWINHLLNTMLL